MDIASIPVSAVLATRDRPLSLARMLDSLLAQKVLPRELIVVDGSSGQESRELIERWAAQVQKHCNVHCEGAKLMGVAIQRNQGVAVATQPVIWFFDDDIEFEPDCVKRLWSALHSDSQLGGVNAMIVNQRYQTPGLVSRVMFTLMHGRPEKSFAGRMIGPAINLLPEDREDLPEVVQVEWLNTTCTLYRREALPSPPFDSIFTGYSLMEDVALSVVVGRTWKLANARTARIYHNSQPGAHKANVAEVVRMQLINRHYVMTEILNRRGVTAYAQLVLWELFGVASSSFSKQGLKTLPQALFGRLAGAATILQKSLS